MTAPPLDDAPRAVAPAAPPPKVSGGQTRGGRIWFAQMVRGIAPFLVVYEHYVPEFTRYQTGAREAFALGPKGEAARLAFNEPLHGLPHFADPPTNWMESRHFVIGMVAVGMFFLTSGFVIPYSLEQRSLRAFAIRRFFRLYPTLWLVLAIALIAIRIRYPHNQPFPYTKGEILGSAFLIGPYFGRMFVDPVFWTLMVEEVFYATAALLAWRGLLASRLALCGTALGLGLVTIFVGDLAVPQFGTGIPTSYHLRIQIAKNASFVIFVFVGVVMHHWYKKLWKPRESLLIMAGLIGWWYAVLRLGPFNDQQLGHYDVYFRSFMAAFLIFAVAFWLADKLPFSSILNWSADISYPMYLLHTVTGYILMSALYMETNSYWIAIGVTTPIIFGTATVIHYVLEMPSNNFGKQLARRITRTEPATAPA